MGSWRSRAGFTLMEVAVSAVLIGILAAATIPTLSEFIETRDAETTAKTLSSIATGIAAFKAVVVQGAAGTNVYPGRISYLTNAITTTSLNSCGTTYASLGATTNLVANWNANAPFVTFYIPPGGLQTPVGTIQDAMVRTPATANVGTLAIVMLAIDSMDAVRLERVIDGDDASGTDLTTGVFRITAWNGSGTATRTANVQYIMPVANKC
jgi:prepilin-type N-terminal cleavage/methylation domain-containing protein